MSAVGVKESAIGASVTVMAAVGTLMFLVSAASTSTPADRTGVCDGLAGPTWSLCSAYCEVRTCVDEPGVEVCEDLHDSFVRRTGFEPPCVHTDDGLAASL